MIDPITKKRIKRYWNIFIAACSATAGWAAITMPQYQASLGRWGVPVLLAVRAIDFALNKLPTLLPDESDEAGA